MTKATFHRTRPYIELSNDNFLPRNEIRRAILEQLDCLTGEHYKFKLVLCRETANHVEVPTNVAPQRGELYWRQRALSAEIAEQRLRLQITPAVTDGITLIAAERARQVTSEGWDAGHDDAHGNGELSQAAVCYMLGSAVDWPWDMGWWKPSDRIRNLVKAGALIAAEIDRLRRGFVRMAEEEDFKHRFDGE